MNFVRSIRLRVVLFSAILSLLFALPAFAGTGPAGTILSVTRDKCDVTITVRLFQLGPAYLNVVDDGQLVQAFTLSQQAGVLVVHFTITQPAQTAQELGIIFYLGQTANTGVGDPSFDSWNFEYPDDVPAHCGDTGGCILLPVGAVEGSLPQDTPAYWAPGKITSNVVINRGTYWVIDEEQGDDGNFYYKIILSCQYLYVPVDAMGPSYESPWTGQPLPTSVPVEE